MAREAEITLTIYGEDGSELAAIHRNQYAGWKEREDRNMQRLAAAINAGKVTAKVTATTKETEELPEVEYRAPEPPKPPPVPNRQSGPVLPTHRSGNSVDG